MFHCLDSGLFKAVNSGVSLVFRCLDCDFFKAVNSGVLLVFRLWLV